MNSCVRCTGVLFLCNIFFHYRWLEWTSEVKLPGTLTIPYTKTPLPSQMLDTPSSGSGQTILASYFMLYNIFSIIINSIPPLLTKIPASRNPGLTLLWSRVKAYLFLHLCLHSTISFQMSSCLVTYDYNTCTTSDAICSIIFSKMISHQPYRVYEFMLPFSSTGYWLLHCHLLFHSVAGMNMVFKVGEDTDIPPAPEGFPTCANYEGST